nr:hypothetical protein [Nocardiopsis mwathae]
MIDASVATDPHPFPAAAHKVYTLVPQVPEEERELALEALAPILAGGHALPGVAADLSLIAGAMVESGTDPGTTGVEVVRLLRLMGKGAAVFLSAWERTGGGTPPDPDTVTAEAEERVAADLAEAAPTATVCWWTIRRHGLAAKTMLGESAVRAAIRADAALHAELVAVSNQLSAALWEFDEVRALLRMAETTSAVVLDRASGRAFRVLFDGIGDNVQLHTLLADALVGPEGRGLDGRRPDPRWTASYRTDAPDPEARVVRGWWNLTAADGSWIWNESVPADIPAIDGERIVVLDPQTFPRTWNAGRRHPHVSGWLEVEEELTSDEAFGWWRRVASTTATGTAATPHTPTPPSTGAPPAVPDGFPAPTGDDTPAQRPALEEIRASAGPVPPTAKRTEPREPAAPADTPPQPPAVPADAAAPAQARQAHIPAPEEEVPGDPAPRTGDGAPAPARDRAGAPQEPADDPRRVDAFLERTLGSLQVTAEQSTAPAAGDGQPAPAATAPEPAPHTAAAPGRASEPYAAATEVFPVITPELIAQAEHADEARTEGHGPPSPTAGPDPAGQGDDEEADARPPGASLLPPLPPGVSDSSRWGPTWL